MLQISPPLDHDLSARTLGPRTVVNLFQRFPGLGLPTSISSTLGLDYCLHLKVELYQDDKGGAYNCFGVPLFHKLQRMVYKVLVAPKGQTSCAVQPPILPFLSFSPVPGSWKNTQ